MRDMIVVLVPGAAAVANACGFATFIGSSIDRKRGFCGSRPTHRTQSTLPPVVQGKGSLDWAPERAGRRLTRPAQMRLGEFDGAQERRLSMRLERSIALPFSCHGVEFSPFEGGRLAVATSQYFGIVGNGRLHIIDRDVVTGGLQEVCSFDTQAGLYDCAWSECNPRQIVTAGADSVVKLWDLGADDGFPIADWREHEKEVSGVDWNLVSKFAFASTSWDGTVRVLVPGVPAPVRTFREHGQHPVYGAIWCPSHDGQLLSFSGDGTAKVLDVNAPRAAVVLDGHGGEEVISGDWDKYNQHTVVTGSADGTVRMWDLRTPGHPLSAMLEHRYAVRRLRCSPHATGVLASASYDKTVVLWDSGRNHGASDGGVKVRRCVGHTEFVAGLAFSLVEPRLLASCAWDRRLCLWSLA